VEHVSFIDLCVSQNLQKLLAFKLSNQADPPKLASILVTEDDMIEQLPVMLLVKEQSYVSCIYNNTKPLIGLVQDISDEMGDSHIKLIHPNAGFMKKTLLVCLIETPFLAMPTRMYHISKKLGSSYKYVHMTIHSQEI